MKQPKSLASNNNKKKKILLGCAIAFSAAIGTAGVIIGVIALSRKTSVQLNIDDQYLNYGESNYRSNIRAICTATYTATDSKPVWAVNFAIGDKASAINNGGVGVAFGKTTNTSSVCYVRYAHDVSGMLEHADKNGNVPLIVKCTVNGVPAVNNLMLLKTNTVAGITPDSITNQTYDFTVDDNGGLDTNFKMASSSGLGGLSSYIHAKDTADFSDLDPWDPKLIEYMSNEFDARDIALLYIIHAMSAAWDNRNITIRLVINDIMKTKYILSSGDESWGYKIDVVESNLSGNTYLPGSNNGWQDMRLITTTQNSGTYSDQEPNSCTRMDNMVWTTVDASNIHVSNASMKMNAFTFDFDQMPNASVPFRCFNKTTNAYINQRLTGSGCAYDFNLGDLHTTEWNNYGFGTGGFATQFLFPNVEFPIENY